MKVKWKEELNQDDKNDSWTKIFRVCFEFKCDASLTWFQYRLLYRILGVRKYLSKIGKDTSSLCRLCNDYEETLVHLFFECSKSQDLWRAITNWLKNKVNITIEFNVKSVLFGHLEKSKSYKLVNLVILHAKKYIFHCAMNYNFVNIYFFQRRFKSVFYEHFSVLRISTQSDSTISLWKSWEPLFENI